MAKRTCSIDGCERVHFGRGWCSRHYHRWYQHGDPLYVEPRPTIDARFFTKVDKHPDGCWLWTASRNPDGYGRFQIAHKLPGLAHRWSYEYHVGPIPEGMDLDHLCRVRHCVNPEHLEPVEPVENIARGIVGEHNRRKTHCPSGHPYSGSNLYVKPSGARTCRTCRTEQKRARRKRNGSGS